MLNLCADEHFAFGKLVGISGALVAASSQLFGCTIPVGQDEVVDKITVRAIHDVDLGELFVMRQLVH